MNFKQAAIKILKEAKKPLHYREIAKRAIEKTLITTEGKTPDSTMNAKISSEIKYKAREAAFVRKGKGVYDINPEVNISEVLREEDYTSRVIEESEEEAIESGYTAKAGEHAVCSELLFRGYNSSLMSVDEGIDIVATKNGKSFFIQVKTANALDKAVYGELGRDFVFDIRVTSFERHNSSNVYYVFVLRHADYFSLKGEQLEDRYYLIIPYLEMEKYTKSGLIKKVGGDKRYRVNIKIRDGIKLGRVNNDVTYYVNNWEVIK